MPSIPAADLSRLFLQTAEAAVRAQLMLDTQSLEGRRVYAIPGVDVRAKFALDIDARTGLIALLFGSQSQSTTHNLQFELRAAPSVPAGDDLSSLDERCTEPPWMVPVAERRHLTDVLTLALRMNRCVVEIGVPGAADFYPEAQAIDDAATNTKEDSIGVVYFRLSDSPARYLIVRVGDAGMRNGHDGIFLVSPDDAIPVTVFDFLTSPKSSTISYGPIDELFTILSQWLVAGLPGAALRVDSIPSTFGDIPFAEFAQEMWSSYVAALNATAAADPSKQPVYALTGVTAQFAHAVPPPGNRDAAENESPFISSRVALTIDRGTLAARLVCPEYLLAEDARAAFVAQIAGSIDQIVAEAEPSEQDAWRAALNDSRARNAAVITLSYRGSNPQNEFLVVHPAVWNGHASSFAFTCSIGKDGPKDFARCKSLNDNRLDRDSYVGFHNFWHAVRIWEMAGKWFIAK